MLENQRKQLGFVSLFRLTALVKALGEPFYGFPISLKFAFFVNFHQDHVQSAWSPQGRQTRGIPCDLVGRCPILTF